MAPIRICHRTFGAYIKGGLICALAALAVWYGHFQARSFLEGPEIALESPGAPLQTDRTVAVAGTAHNITELTLNGKQIHTNEEGRFEEILVLPEGYTIMTLYAKDRFGRTTSLSKELTFVPSPQGTTVTYQDSTHN